MTNRRKYIPMMYISLIVFTVLLISGMVSYANAYFTSTSTKDGNINFHNVELQINSTDQNSDIFSTDAAIMPGATIDFSHVSVKNTGTAGIYSLINLNVYVQRVGYTASATDLWYNLDGDLVDYKDISNNTTSATEITAGASKSLDVEYLFNPDVFDNTYKKATVRITIKAVGIQTSNLEEVDGITEDTLIASYMLVNDFHVDQPNNVIDLGQISESQPSLKCDEPTEQITIDDTNYSLFNFKVENTNPGDKVYVQAANADQVAIIPGTYDLGSLDLNNLPEGTVQAYGQTVTTFTVPEQTYKLTKSFVKTENVLPYDWDGTFTVGAINSIISTKKPTVRVYLTPQDDLPDIVDGLGVYQIKYADIKQTPSTFTIPMETYGGFDVSNYIVSNITENSTVTVFADNAAMNCIASDNMSLQAVQVYIDAGQLPPNSVIRGYIAWKNNLSINSPCAYSFPVSAGDVLKFCVAGMNNFNDIVYEPKVSVYVTPTGNLPLVNGDVAYQLLEDGTGYSAFAAHDFVQTANILDTINGKPVKEINELGFVLCPYLSSVSISSDTTSISIGVSAFNGCDGLNSFSLPAKQGFLWAVYDGNSYTALAKNKTQSELISYLKNDYDFKQIEISDDGLIYLLASDGKSYSVMDVEDKTKTIYSIKSQIDGIPVTSIGYRAFLSCTTLTEIEIPASVTSIGYYAFEGCSKLSRVIFAANSKLTTIGNYAFYGCTSLAEIEIPASVTSIGSCAFYGCTTLTEIEIPASVTTIERYAFQGCTNLSTLTLNAKDGYVWAIYQGTTTTTTVVADASTLTQAELITYAKGSYNFKQVKYIDGVAYSLSADGRSYSVVSVEDKTLSTYAIQSQINGKPVTSIGSNAFENCRSLTEIEIPASVTLIGNYAFCNCTSLTEIEIPASVTEIGNYAFDNCDSLTEIEIPASVTSIGSCAFYGCSNLDVVTFGANSKLTTIGANAFNNCISLTEIEIPASVTSIENNAFYGCSNLSTLTLNAKDGYVWAIYYQSYNSFVALADGLTQTQLISYAKDYYNFKQVAKS